MLRFVGQLLMVVIMGAAATLIVGQFASRHVEKERLQETLDAVSRDLRVNAVLHEQREGDFIGPGSNGVELIVLSLPQSSADSIHSGGVVALDGMLDRRFTGWRPTPVNVDDPAWAGEREKPSPGLASIGEFFALNSFIRMEVDEPWRKEIDAILASPGSYYAYRGHSIALVAPAKRWAVLAFAK